MYAPANDMIYERELLNYAAVYAGSVFREYPVSRQSRRVLRQLQYNSRLQNKDVAAIEARVFERKAALELAANDQHGDRFLPALRTLVAEHLHPVNQVTPPPPPIPQPPAPPQESSSWQPPVWLQASVYTVVGLLCLIGIGAIAFHSLQNPATTPSPPVEPAPSPVLPATPAPPVELSPTPAQPSPSASPSPPAIADTTNVNTLRDRCQQLRVDYAFLLRLSNQATLISTGETAPTAEIPQNASQLLDRLENAVDRAILPNLGQYTPVQARQQKQRITELGQSVDAIDREADRRFQALFPRWRKGDKIQGTGLDQVWFALVDQILKEQETKGGGMKGEG